MSAPVCSSRFQCRLNGVFGTAVALSALMLLWRGAELLSGRAAPGAALLGLLPLVLAVALWAGVRLSTRQPGWASVAIASACAAWGVMLLNGGAQL